MNTTTNYSKSFVLVINLTFSGLLSGCASTPEVAPVAYQQTVLPPVVTYALSLQGAPYHYGSETPEEGFDCSGFIHHVYLQQGVNLPRTTADMAANLTPVDKESLQAGDLVFFDTNGKLFSHVGLYIDGDKFIHAPSARTGKVLISSLQNDYWLQHFVGGRRPLLPLN